ncbi:MAG: hypothetical protein EBS68_11295 [Rhodobacteraceae bacterium]|jgi:hypothetical protein|nr:hypothetical protein [Paracoccaceae bacterium]
MALPKGGPKNMNAHSAKLREPKTKNPEQFAIEIGLFDDNNLEDGNRVVPLAHFLNELHDLPLPQR